MGGVARSALDAGLWTGSVGVECALGSDGHCFGSLGDFCQRMGLLDLWWRLVTFLPSHTILMFWGQILKTCTKNAWHVQGLPDSSRIMRSSQLLFQCAILTTISRCYSCQASPLQKLAASCNGMMRSVWPSFLSSCAFLHQTQLNRNPPSH